MTPTSSPHIVLRDASPEDTVALVRVLIRTKEESLPTLTDDHDRDVAFWEDRWYGYIKHGSRAQQALGDSFTILAECVGQLAGFAAYHHTRRWNCDAELQSLYVLPDHQRLGIGTMLLQEIIRRLRAEGSTSLCVGYAPDNPYKRFYAKHGAIEINPHWAVWRELPVYEAIG